MAAALVVLHYSLRSNAEPIVEVASEEVYRSSDTEPRGKLLEKETENDLKYLLYLPKNPTSKPSPMIVFLHGRGESGAFDQTTQQSLPFQLDTNSTLTETFPFITIVPQCPRRCAMLNGWQEDILREVTKLVNQVAEKYGGNLQRVSLAGQSMGGNGAWEYAAMQKGLFSSVVVVCGYARTHLYTRERLASHLRGTPIWVFHAENDAVISVRASDEMVETLKHDTTRATILYTRYSEAPPPPMERFSALEGHGSYELAFRDKKLYEW
eukprot:CAMPEP_0167766776 /NCGR_PEP_ID=MMETSP0110_2-20121227/15567_1 /TAXON_ID=629695 /ORGANISM="Gymnochlora sp., Strain CCMP2014" /LENGTH=266 /DNA_ID=CAMNT_0007654911 /DNA_START=251 /DNA_END=1048 /DNA_ORIENTATION=-